MNSFKLRLFSLLASKSFTGELSEEASIQREFAEYCKFLAIEGRLKATFTAISNEYVGGMRPLFGLKLKALGKVSGAPDMVFIWEGGGGWIEFKSKKGRLSESQQIFEEWCQAHNINHVVARSFEEGKEALTKWGLL